MTNKKETKSEAIMKAAYDECAEAQHETLQEIHNITHCDCFTDEDKQILIKAEFIKLTHHQKHALEAAEKAAAAFADDESEEPGISFDTETVTEIGGFIIHDPRGDAFEKVFDEFPNLKGAIVDFGEATGEFNSIQALKELAEKGELPFTIHAGEPAELASTLANMLEKAANEIDKDAQRDASEESETESEEDTPSTNAQSMIATFALGVLAEILTDKKPSDSDSNKENNAKSDGETSDETNGVFSEEEAKEYAKELVGTIAEGIATIMKHTVKK